jgi:DNA-binding PadR family transcriptional regulator
MRESQPLPPAAFFVLFALAGGDKHGYAIMQESRTLSDGQFEMGPATLYTTIQRLLKSGLIGEVPGPKGSDSRRRFCRISRQGRSALNLELARMDAVVRKSKTMKLRPAESRS